MACAINRPHWVFRLLMLLMIASSVPNCIEKTSVSMGPAKSNAACPWGSAGLVDHARRMEHIYG